MSTENEAGSGSAAEPAAPAPDGAQAAQAPVPPAAPPTAPPVGPPPAPPTAPPAAQAPPSAYGEGSGYGERSGQGQESGHGEGSGHGQGPGYGERPGHGQGPGYGEGSGTESRTEILPEIRDEAPAGPPADPYAKPADPYASSPSAPPSSAPAPVPSAYAPPTAPPSPYNDPPVPAAFAAERPHGGPGSGDPFAPPAPPYGGSPQPQPAPGQPGGPLPPMWGGHVPAPPNERKRRGLGSLLAAVVVAALVAGGIGGGVGYWAAEHDDNNNSSSSTTVSDSNSQKAFNRAPTSVAGIASKALPSVVTIKATGSQESGTGTGFVYDTEGHILTNNHVVAPAADGGKLTVTFSNGKTYDAAVVGRAEGYDVAVIKLKGAGGIKLTPLPLGNSDQSQVGDATIAIGAPFGLSGTVTTGIVSAVHRPVASSDGQGSSASYMSAIQTDASINPGNSGGPLLNANGAVIGINSAIQPAGNTEPGTQSGSVGLGFAIPINQAKRVADQLIKTGQPVYPLIGVSLDTQYQGDGAKISTAANAVTSGGPGADAGLRAGDVITKFDDTLIDSGQTLIGEIWQHSPGHKATITYTRNGQTHTTTVTLGSRTGDSN